VSRSSATATACASPPFMSFRKRAMR